MDTTTLVSDIAARLARLEQSNRRLRLALGAVVVAASSLALGAFASFEPRPAITDEVRATSITLVDAKNVERATLGVTSSGETIFRMDSAARTPTDVEGEMSFTVADGRASLKVGKDPSAVISAMNAKGREGLKPPPPKPGEPVDLGQLLMGAAVPQLPPVSFRLYSSESGDVPPSSAGAAAAPSRATSGKIGTFEVSIDSRSAVSMKAGAVGRSEFEMISDPASGAALSLGDASGRRRAVFGAGSIFVPRGRDTTSDPASTILLFGPDGKLAESLPR